MNVNALQAYLASFDIAIATPTPQSASLHFGLRIAADVIIGAPVIAVFQGQHEIAREVISPLLGLRAYQARNLGNTANLAREHWDEFMQLAADLYRCYLAANALLIQLEALHISEGHITATHCTLHLDQAAEVGQAPELVEVESADAPNFRAVTRETGIAFLPLKGQIGVLANGAGLAMAAMDMIAHYSGDSVRAANFMDIGNDLRIDKLATALEILREETQIRALLITLFGAAQCVTAAHTLTALDHVVPTVVYLSGSDTETARAIIERTNSPILLTAGTLREAVRRAIHLVSGAQAEGA